MKIIIGGSGYPERRNIMTDPSKNYRDYHFRNVWTWINAIRQRILRKNKLFIFRPIFMISSSDAIIHLFNEVSTGSGCWIATFETELPRVLPVRGIEKFKNSELARELKHVSSSRCKGIIAISEATRQIQLQLLERFPAERDAILPKLHVIHPPQPVLQEKMALKNGGPLIFTFVGNEFYRKGGAEVVLAFSQLFSEGRFDENGVRVNIIGDITRRHNIAHGDFQDDNNFRGDVEGYLKDIPIFHHHTSMLNKELIEIIKSSDVGLLPTWQDTYGFSVLEMQACGCPVISTDVRALPEINPVEAGWLIRCPLNNMLEITIDSQGDKIRIRDNIIYQLKSHIINIVDNREEIEVRSARARERIRCEHNPDSFNRRLNALYQGTL